MDHNILENSIYNLIHDRVEQEELKDQILRYVKYQSNQGFPFGELLILHFRMFNQTESEAEEIYSVAAAIELLILSFDMFDDFEDNDSEDKPWMTEVNLALNVTTALLLLSISIIRDTSFTNNEKAISILLKYALQSVDGQHKDLLNHSRDEADYIEMTIKKSGSLVAMACLVGVVLATADYPPEIEIYSKFLGLIGQINNDLIGIESWNKNNDLMNRKYTLPIIYILNYKDEDIRFIRDYYDNLLDRSEMIERQELIYKKFKETGALKYSEVIKRIFQNKAHGEMKRLNIDQYHIDLLLKYIY